MHHQERLWMWVAWRLPRQLAYWAALRVIVVATAGRHGATDPGELDVMEALRRWERSGAPRG
jgi:hypothetical protein